MVDFPVPLPPMIALYCGFKVSSMGPMNLLLLTETRSMYTEGKTRMSWDIRDSFAKQAWRSASAVGSDRFCQISEPAPVA